MAYTPTTWVNDSSPYLDETNLNKMETGIDDAHTDIATAQGDITTLQGSVSTLQTDLAALDATDIAYTPAWVGASATTVNVQVSDRIVVRAAADLQAAITAAVTNQKRLIIAAGEYEVATPLTATLTGDQFLHVEGDGTGNTVLKVTGGGNGLTITTDGDYWLSDTASGSTGLSLSDFTISTTNSNTGNAIDITGACVEGRPAARSDLRNLEIRGHALQTQGFATGVRLLDFKEVWFHHCRILPGGPTNTTNKSVVILGTAQANSPTSFYFNNCAMTYGGVGVEVGDYVEGLYFTNCEIVGQQTGILWDATTSSASGLQWVGGHMNIKSRGFDLTNVFDWDVVGALLWRTGTTANSAIIENTTGSRFSVTGNTLIGANTNDGETAILVTSSSAAEQYGGTIAGNTFHNFATRAVWLAANSNYINVGGDNIFRNCAVRVLDQGTNDNNTFAPKMYVRTQAITVTGGATTENVDITVPPNIFRTTPGCALFQPNQQAASAIVGEYDYVNSSATTTRFVLRNPAGGNITGGTYRVSYLIFEDVYAGTY